MSRFGIPQDFWDDLYNYQTCNPLIETGTLPDQMRMQACTAAIGARPSGQQARQQWESACDQHLQLLKLRCQTGTTIQERLNFQGIQKPIRPIYTPQAPQVIERPQAPQNKLNTRNLLFAGGAILAGYLIYQKFIK